MRRRTGMRPANATLVGDFPSGLATPKAITNVDRQALHHPTVLVDELWSMRARRARLR